MKTKTNLVLFIRHLQEARQYRHTETMARNDQRKLRSNVGVLPALALVECYKSAGQADAHQNVPADGSRSEVAPAVSGPRQSATRSGHSGLKRFRQEVDTNISNLNFTPRSL